MRIMSVRLTGHDGIQIFRRHHQKNRRRSAEIDYKRVGDGHQSINSSSFFVKSLKKWERERECRESYSSSHQKKGEKKRRPSTFFFLSLFFLTNHPSSSSSPHFFYYYYYLLVLAGKPQACLFSLLVELGPVTTSITTRFRLIKKERWAGGGGLMAGKILSLGAERRSFKRDRKKKKRERKKKDAMGKEIIKKKVIFCSSVSSILLKNFQPTPNR